MLKVVVSLLVLVVSSAFAGDIVDDVREECGVFQGASHVQHQYCIYTPVDQHADGVRQVMFHFPGYPETVHAGRNFVSIYSFYFKQSRRVTPYFVTIFSGSMNGFTDLVEKGTTLSTADSFVTEFVPWLRGKLNTANDLHAFGYSLGGFNVLRLISMYPGLFKGVSLSCPAVFTVSPFKGFFGMRRYMKQTKAKFRYVFFYFRRLKKYFKQAAAWDRNDLLSNISRFDVPVEQRPFLYISANREDEVGFFTGSKMLYDALRLKGYSAMFESRPGGHIQMSFSNQINALIENSGLGLVSEQNGSNERGRE